MKINKNSFLVLALFCLNGFANTPNFKNNKIDKGIKINKKAKKDVCTVTCSTELGEGISATVTSGNWFTSCESAKNNCTKKMANIIS